MKSQTVKRISFVLMVLSFFAVVPWMAFAETDVTSKVELIKSGLVYDRRTLTSSMNVSVKNISQDVLLTPIKVVIDSISTTDVTITNADGVTDDGKPYFKYQTNNGRLPAGITSTGKQWFFKNIKNLRFSYTTRILGSELAKSIIEPPSEEKAFQCDLGGEAPPIISTKKYVGSIGLPPGFKIVPEKLFIESGIAGQTAISNDGLFKAEMNCETTSLLTVIDENGNAYLMKLFPKSDDIREQNPKINAKSTAIALIAMQAGVITGESNIDAIILQFINNLPETQIVADRIDYELKNGLLSLNGSLSADLLQKCINANKALNKLTFPNAIALNFIDKFQYNMAKAYEKIVPNAYAGWIGFNCTDENSEVLYDKDGVDKDGVCLSGDIKAAGGESSFFMQNKAGRWSVLGLDSNNKFTSIDWVQPRSISLPTIDGLLQEIVQLSYEELKDFYLRIFKDQEDSKAFLDRLTDAASSYMGNGSSQGKYLFPDKGTYSLSTVGAHLKGFSQSNSDDYRLKIFQSLVLSTLTEVISPWISVESEMKKSDINDSIKYSISKNNCLENYKEFLIPSKPKLIDTYTKFIDEGIPSAFSGFISDFVLDGLISSDGAAPGLKTTACLLKGLFSWQQIRAKVINKIKIKFGAAGIGGWVGAINKGILIGDAITSTTLFLNTICKSDLDAIDNYNVVIKDIPCTIYVDAAATGAGTGESIENAMTSLSMAIVHSYDDKYADCKVEIRVMPGTYDLLRTYSVINENVSLIGEDREKVIITGQGVSSSGLVSNITFKGCSGLGFSGGGVDNIGGIVKNCTFIDCTSGWMTGGGGVYNVNGGLVENCDFYNCTSWFLGGGVTNEKDSYIINCNLYNCTSKGQSLIDPAGICNRGGIVRGCIITGSRPATGYASYAIALINNGGIVTGCTISNTIGYAVKGTVSDCICFNNIVGQYYKDGILVKISGDNCGL